MSEQDEYSELGEEIEVEVARDYTVSYTIKFTKEEFYSIQESIQYNRVDDSFTSVSEYIKSKLFGD